MPIGVPPSRPSNRCGWVQIGAWPRATGSPFYLLSKDWLASLNLKEHPSVSLPENLKPLSCHLCWPRSQIPLLSRPGFRPSVRPGKKRATNRGGVGAGQKVRTAPSPLRERKKKEEDGNWGHERPLASSLSPWQRSLRNSRTPASPPDVCVGGLEWSLLKGKRPQLCPASRSPPATSKAHHPIVTIPKRATHKGQESSCVALFQMAKKKKNPKPTTLSERLQFTNHDLWLSALCKPRLFYPLTNKPGFSQ